MSRHHPRWETKGVDGPRKGLRKAWLERVLQRPEQVEVVGEEAVGAPRWLAGHLAAVATKT